MENKKIIIILAVILIIGIIFGIIYAVQSSKKINKDTQQTTQTEDLNSNEESQNDTSSDDTSQNKVTPTFMFFYSEKQESDKQALKIVEELQKEHQDVKFDIKNIDADAQIAKNYSVEGMTPAVIMLNTKNDICAFVPKCADKTTMENIISKAFN